MSDNPAGRKYDSVELIFRNAGKVDEFAEMTVRLKEPPAHSPAELPSLEGCVPCPENLRDLMAGVGRDMP
jgi:hypothetical protein